MPAKVSVDGVARRCRGADGAGAALGVLTNTWTVRPADCGSWYWSATAGCAPFVGGTASGSVSDWSGC